MFDNVDEFLAHVGKKGMKWGVRRELARQAALERSADRGDKIIKKRNLSPLQEIKKGPYKGDNYLNPSDHNLGKKQVANSLALFGALTVSSLIKNKSVAGGLAVSAGVLTIANGIRMDRNSNDITNAFRRDYGV